MVFKPRGHVEVEHAHPRGQRLIVVRGRLALRMGTRRIVLGPRSGPFTVAAGRRHATRALADTWLVADAGGAAL